VFLVLGEIITN